MGRKGENIHKRKDGRWEARLIKYKIDGTSAYHSIYGKTYTEVKEKKRIYLEEKNTKESIPKYNKTFGDVLIEWFNNRFFNQKESTKLKYKNIIDIHIIPQLGNINIASIDDIIINSFLQEKKKHGRKNGDMPLSNSYIKSMSIIISSVINYAVEKEYRLPLKAKIIKPIVEKPDIQVLSNDEQKALEDALQYDTSKTALGIIIALNTGLRIGEVCALSWDDIDLNSKIIKIRKTVTRIASSTNSESKTELVIGTPKTVTSARDIPITSKLYPILNYACKEGGYVISETNDFVIPRTFEYRFHRKLAEYDLPDINFHILRHTFATRCVEKNVDIKTLSEILGHSNVGITLNYYVHPSNRKKKTQLEKLCN